MELKHEMSPKCLLNLLSFLYWSTLYIWCCVRWPKHSPEWCSRLVTLLHGSVATVIGLSQCGITSLSERTLTMKIGTRHYALMVWSWGYFAFDLLWCLIYWTNNKLMLCHHVSALVAITIYMQKEYTGCTFACTLAMMEVTNPLLQARWFLRNGQREKSRVYFLIELCYLALFITIRGILGSYVILKIIQSDLFDMDEKVISIVFYIVSLGFIKDILEYIAHKYNTTIQEFGVYLDEISILLNNQL
ncbi:hypothetical protein ACJJTC_009166 [Scirpophaga incertulas]